MPPAYEAYKRAQRLKKDEEKQEGLGLWVPLPTATPGLRSGGISLTPQVNCDPAYPDVCIPSPPPYLNCPDITSHNFRVLPPDPHGFDRDGNGLGCEGGRINLRIRVIPIRKSVFSVPSVYWFFPG